MSAEERVAGTSLASAAADPIPGTPDQSDEGHNGGFMDAKTAAATQQAQRAVEADRNPVDFDESVLAAASISGDSQAFEELYTHYFPKVRALCIRKIGNVHLAEDIAQEAFARAFERISEFGGPRHFGGWVGTIAANLCTDHLRRKKPVASVDQMLETNESSGPVYEFDPIRTVQREDTGRLVRLALARLDPRQAEALVLHEIKGLSCAAVGERLGISEVAAESLLARARRRLRKEITAKAIPADLFGLGGLGLLPALLRGWKRVRVGVSNRADQAHSAATRGWDSLGTSFIPGIDAAKALVVVMGAALATQMATAATPPTLSSPGADPGTHSAAPSSSSSLLTVDGDNDEADRRNRIPVRFHADPENGTAGASVRGEVQLPDPTGESGYSGLNVSVDLEGDDESGSVSTRVWVQEEDGSSSLDTGEIGHEVALEQF